MTPRPHAVVAAVGTALAVLAMAAAIDRYFAHGYEVTWRTLDVEAVPDTSATADGGVPAAPPAAPPSEPETAEIVVVDSRVEHRTAFPNPHRVLGRYVQEWDFERWGVPNAFPPLDLRFRATLTVPEGPPLLVRARSPNQTDVIVDGLRAERPLEPGEHDLTVYWHGPLHPEGAPHWTRILPTSYVLEWGPDEESLEPVDRAALSVPPDVPDPARTALWIIALALALLLGLAVYAIARARSREGARRGGLALATLLIVSLGLGLRLWDYDVVPEFRENMDELFATWNGWQLLDDGTTRGWTLWPARYVGLADLERIEYFRERPITVVSPYFEHPPLLHLLAGAAAHLGGTAEYTHARLGHTRLVPIGLGCLTILLLVLVARRIAPTGPAPYLAALVYATMPHAVLMNRVIKEEALLAPLALGVLLFFLRWRDDGRRIRDVVVAGVLAGLCAWTKVPGLVFVVVLALLVARHGRMRDAAVGLGTGAAVSSLLLVYGAAIDWELFWYVTRDQATMRGSTWQEFVPFFFDSLINHNRVGRGWLVFLWIAFVGAAAVRMRDEAHVVVVPTIGYLVAMGLASGGWHYGWYLLPVEPLLCIGAGWFLADLWERPDLLRGSLLVLLPVAYDMAFLYDPKWVMALSSYEPMRRWVTSFVVLFLLPFGLVSLRRVPLTVTAARITTAVAVALAVALNVFFVLRYDMLYEAHKNLDDATLCDRCEEQGFITPSSPAQGRAPAGSGSP